MTITLLCPNCRERVDMDALSCSNGHHYGVENGVLTLLETSFGQRLKAFTTAFNAIRSAEHKQLMDSSAYEGLPFSQMNRGDAGWHLEWRLRGYDLAILLKLLRPRRRRVLDVGAWNGWLSHRLSLQGCEVTAVDYFADEHDGLGARKFYSTNWRAIQIDLTDLSVLDECFDIVVLNRCLQFFPDPLRCVRAACQMLSPGGRLIATGLQFYQDPSHKARQVAETRQSYQERYGFELFLRPTKAYLDFDDMKDLEAAGLALKPYPQLRLANLKAAFKRAQPRHVYGVYEAGGSEPGR